MPGHGNFGSRDLSRKPPGLIYATDSQVYHRDMNGVLILHGLSDREMAPPRSFTPILICAEHVPQPKQDGAPAKRHLLSPVRD